MLCYFRYDNKFYATPKESFLRTNKWCNLASQESGSFGSYFTSGVPIFLINFVTNYVLVLRLSMSGVIVQLTNNKIKNSVIHDVMRRLCKAVLYTISSHH